MARGAGTAMKKYAELKKKKKSNPEAEMRLQVQKAKKQYEKNAYKLTLCQSRVRSEGGRVARIGRIPYNAVDYRWRPAVVGNELKDGDEGKRRRTGTLQWSTTQLTLSFGTALTRNGGLQTAR